MSEIPPITFEPRQARIYEQLLRLGDAPAGYFRDACRLFQSQIPLDSPGTIVGHLLRELKGSVKDVLYPDEKRDQKAKKKHQKKSGAPKEEKRDGDLNAIRVIAERYGLPADHEIIGLWPELHLETFAHRGGLAVRPTLADIQKAWDELQLVLGVLLDALDGAYTQIYERLDRLIAIENPTDEDLKELLQKVPHNPSTLGYFFARVAGRGWFDRLRGSSIFDHPTVGGYWPQAEYLRRMSAEYPADVAPIMEKVAGTWSYFTHHQILEALPALSASDAGRIVKTVAVSVMTARGHDTFLATDLAKRAADLGKAEVDAAVEVFATLLVLRPDADEPRGGYFGARELKSPLEFHTYSDVVGEPLHAMIKVAPRKTFDVLVRLLDAALGAVYASSKPDDTSKGWMPAIEPHEQNSYHYQALPRLAEALRDAAEAVIGADPTTLQCVTDELHDRGWQSMERLRIHLVAKFGDPADSFVQAFVLDEALFFDYNVRHEYGALVRKVFPTLSAVEQARVIGWMNEGPRDLREDLAPEDREYMQKSWAHLRLSWVREHLSQHDLAVLEKLDADLGQSKESAEFSGYMTGMFSGPTSPKKDDELKALAIPELIAYLRGWQPSGERLTVGGFAPTREGLARQLQPIVKSRAGEFAAAARSFVGLDPTYVRAILAGFEDAAKENTKLDWRAVLELCAWAVAQPREIPGRDAKGFDNDPHWGWARATIARLLRAGIVAKGDARVPMTLRPAVWDVLSVITDDPDPDIERDAEERDPYSTAINSTRGVGIETLVTYAGWVRGAFKAPADPAMPFAEMPEVEAVLNRHIDLTIDASPAVRAIYGASLFFLYKLFPGWVEAHFSDLFPPTRPDLADAVLRTYLGWGQYTSPEFDRLLAPEFDRTIAGLTAAVSGDERPAYAAHVGARAVRMYLRGEGDLAPLSRVAAFFERADEKTRERVLSLIPSLVRDLDEENQGDARVRAIALLEWRLELSNDGELHGFGQWMDEEAFDAAWRLAQLEKVLQRSGRPEYDFQIAESLARLAPSFPVEALCCARLLVGSNADLMHVHALMYRNNLQKVVRAALVSADAALQREATTFANELVARGLNQFRAVLDPSYQVPDEDED